MKRLRKKLHSERGASILLALLFFLVCMMVGASVLAAAASNAGKIRSNQTEQQKYLTLSSAIRLICDELNQQAKYTGKYKTYEWTVPEKKDAEGNVISPAIDYFYCQQQAGDYTCGDLTQAIPLGPELDAIFNRQFEGKDGYGKADGLDLEAASIIHTLTVTLPEGLTGYPYGGSGPAAYQVPREVTVQVKLDHGTQHITLKAWLGTGGANPPAKNDTLSAELVAETPPVLDYSPEGRIPGVVPGESSRVTVSPAECVLPPTTWKLNWIKKEAS